MLVLCRPAPLPGTNNATRRSGRGTEVRVEDFAVANDVPLRQHRESAFRETGRLDIEFFVRFEMVSERPEELVSYDAALVVREAALPCLVYLEVVAPQIVSSPSSVTSQSSVPKQ